MFIINLAKNVEWNSGLKVPFNTLFHLLTSDCVFGLDLLSEIRRRDDGMNAEFADSLEDTLEAVSSNSRRQIEELAKGWFVCLFLFAAFTRAVALCYAL